MRKIIGLLIILAALAGFCKDYRLQWDNQLERIAVKGGEVTIANAEAVKTTLTSEVIELNQSEAAPVDFGCRIKVGEAIEKPAASVVINRIVYMDGSKGAFKSCSRAGHFRSTDWMDAYTTWMPEKPVKSLVVVVAFHNAGTLYLKDFKLSSVSPDDADYHEKLGKALPRIKSAPAAAIQAQTPAETSKHRMTFQKIYPDAEFVLAVGYPDQSAEEFSKEEFKSYEIPPIIGRGVNKVSFPVEIESDGEYTFLAFFCNAKNVWNRIRILVDGKEVGKRAIDADGPGTKFGATPYRTAVPMQLTAGKHVIDIEYIKPGFRIGVAPDAFALIKGTHKARYQAGEFVYDRKDAANWVAKVSSTSSGSVAGYSSITGDDFEVVIPAVKGAEFIELELAESMIPDTDLVTKAGVRVFDVYLNGKKVLSDYDIWERSKGQFMTREKIRLEKGNPVLRLVSKTEAPAKISTVTLLDAKGKILAQYLFAPEKKSAPCQFDSPFNMVANPGFELNSDNEVSFWRLIAGKAGLDAEAHGGENSLKLDASGGNLLNDVLSMVSWDKPYELSFYAKGQGKVRPRLIWMRHAMYTNKMVQENSSAVSNYIIEQAGVTYGEWQEIDGCKWQKVTLSAMPPRVAERVGFALEWEGEVKVDDFMFDGYGALPIEIMIAQGGYERAGHKKAVIYTRDDFSGGKFIIRSVDNDIKYLGELVKHETYGFKDENGQVIQKMVNRTVWAADFSKLQANGRYNLEVLFPDGQMQRTPIFEIKDGVFEYLGKFVGTNYYPTIRCGTEVPGWHPPCHRDDGDVLRHGKRTHVEAWGGWHDAGDMHVFYFGVADSCVGFAQLIHSVGQDPALVNELCWGLDNLVRVQKADGSFYNRNINNPRVVIERPDKNTDGDPATPDNRTLDRVMPAAPSLMAAYALLQGSEFKKENADKYRNAAIKAVEFFRNKLTIREYPEMVMIGLSGVVPGVEPETYLEKVIECVDNGLYLELWSSGKLGEHEFHQPHALAMLEYLRIRPEGKQAAKVKKAMRKVLDEILIPICGGSPFEQAQEYSVKPNRLFFNTNHGYDISYRYYIGMILGLAAARLNDVQCLRLAESQVYWGTGLNPTGISAIAGIGYRQQNSFNMGANEFPGHENGQYPGGVHHAVNTFRAPVNPRMLGVAFNVDLPQLRGYPYGFQYALPLNDSPSFGPGAEPYIAHAAPFLAACGAIAEAHKVLAGTK